MDHGFQEDSRVEATRLIMWCARHKHQNVESQGQLRLLLLLLLDQHLYGEIQCIVDKHGSMNCNSNKAQWIVIFAGIGTLATHTHFLFERQKSDNRVCGFLYDLFLLSFTHHGEQCGSATAISFSHAFVSERITHHSNTR